MPFVSVNEIDLYFEVHGEGTPIVFIHGRGGNHLSWWQQIPFFSKEFRCVTYDVRGKGRSGGAGKDPVDRVLSEDLNGLMDHLEIESAYLVCQSMGGRTGRGLTVDYPERVSGLVLSGTYGGVDDEIVEVDRLHHTTLTKADGSFPNIVLSRSFSAREPALTFLYSQISGLNPPHKLPDERQVTVRQLADSQVPILIIAGQDDRFFLHPAKVDMYRQKLPAAQFLSLPGVGHSPYFETPHVFNAAVKGFIARLEKNRDRS